MKKNRKLDQQLETLLSRAQEERLTSSEKLLMQLRIMGLWEWLSAQVLTAKKWLENHSPSLSIKTPAAVLLAALLLFLVVGGTAWAARQASPGDALFPLKAAADQVVERFGGETSSSEVAGEQLEDIETPPAEGAEPSPAEPDAATTGRENAGQKIENNAPPFVQDLVPSFLDPSSPPPAVTNQGNDDSIGSVQGVSKDIQLPPVELEIDVLGLKIAPGLQP